MNDAQLHAIRFIADAMLGSDRSWNWSPDTNAYRPGFPMWRECGITHERAVRMQTKYGGRIWRNDDPTD